MCVEQASRVHRAQTVEIGLCLGNAVRALSSIIQKKEGLGAVCVNRGTEMMLWVTPRFLITAGHGEGREDWRTQGTCHPQPTLKVFLTFKCSEVFDFN